MTVALSCYKTLMLDCDGVILDSNRIKTQAFAIVAERHYPLAVSRALTDYHKAHGGISRFKKFAWLLENYAPQDPKLSVEKLALEYGDTVTTLLQQAQETPGLRPLLLKAKELGLDCYVISGGLETELQTLLHKKQLSSFFAGIYGSPRTKDEILTQLVTEGLRHPGLFVGDSRYDLEVAQRFGLTPVFMSMFSEWTEGLNFSQNMQIATISDLRALA